MSPRYIVFRNAEEDKVGAVWWVGYATHIKMWKYLRAKDDAVFYSPLSAGMTSFDSKQKKFRPFDYSASLNLVPHETDHEVLKTVLTDNTKLIAVLGDFGDYPEYTFLIGSTDFLKPEFFTKNKLHGLGTATFRLHDSAKPFKLNFPDVPEKTLNPLFVEFIENKLVT